MASGHYSHGRVLCEEKKNQLVTWNLQDAMGDLLQLTGIMWHIWRRVEYAMDSMATVTADHTESVRRHILLNDISNLPVTHTRAHNLNGLGQGFICDAHQFLVLLGDLANEERLIEIPMVAAMKDSHIYVTDIAILQRTLVGYAVADDLVDAGAARLGEVVVVQWGWVTVAFDGRLVHYAI